MIFDVAIYGLRGESRQNGRRNFRQTSFPSLDEGIPSKTVVHDDLALVGPLNHRAGKRKCSINYETAHVLTP